MAEEAGEFAVYSQEVELERRGLAETREALERQEALSSRYVEGARVLVLSSGTFAVFSGRLHSSSLELVDSPEALIAAILRAQRAARTDWELEQALLEEDRRGAGRKQSLELTAEDLDL